MMELLVSLPVVLLLLTTTALLSFWLYQEYRNQLADWELQEEIQLVMERIVETAHSGSSYVVTDSDVGSRLTIYRRIDDWHGSRVEFSQDSLTYEILAQEGGGKRLTLNHASWPLTGDSDSGKVNISRFECKGDGSMLHITLTGVSRRTGHSFTLSTAVYFPEMRERP